MSEQPVLIQIESSVAWISLNRPQALNGLNEPLCAALVEALARADTDDAVRVMVLTGEGRAFCAGGDLKAIAALEGEERAKRFVAAVGEIISAVSGAQKPVIAMVNGVAAGAGFNLALACDLVIAAENARFIQSFSTVGLIPDCGGNLLLTRAVGPWRAKELMFTAEPVSAAQGREYGFVNRVVAPDLLRAETEALAAVLALRAPQSLAGIKRMVGMAQGGLSALEQMLSAEARLQGRLIVGEDAGEGIKAFFEKRAPEFHGRS